MKVDSSQLVVYIPDTRGVTMSRFQSGNLKLGPGVYTYSRLPGNPARPPLGLVTNRYGIRAGGTCPGSTLECEAICYAARPVTEQGAVFQAWHRNSLSEDVPELPPDCQLLRIHVSGDFTSVPYIKAWIDRLLERSDVRAWAYTRSWRCAELLPALEWLRALPNMQLFASMDTSVEDAPPKGWRVAWIDGDWRVRGEKDNRQVYAYRLDGDYGHIRAEVTRAYVCPEETGRRRDCVECGYCFAGQKHDVIFLRH